MKRSNSEGGVGFRDFHAMNIALLSKQVWRIHQQPDSLWARVIKSIYFPNCSIWEAKKKRNASWAWRSILAGHDFLNHHKAWHIKDGAQVKVFNDKWLINGERLWNDEGDHSNLGVKNLLNADS